MLSLMSVILPSFCALPSRTDGQCFVCFNAHQSAIQKTRQLVTPYWTGCTTSERSQNGSGLHCNFCVHLLLANQPTMDWKWEGPKDKSTNSGEER